MSQTKSKIFGLILFLIIISTIIFVALKPIKEQNAEQIKSLKFSGNQLLSQSSYLSFARLTENGISKEITLPILKARLDKHPFISSTEIEITDTNNAEVRVSEKHLIAILICAEQTFLVSDELELLPLFPSTKFVDMPIISNPKYCKQYDPLKKISNPEILEAYDIINAMRITNLEMYSKLSEINLNRGTGITLTFSKVNPLIKFGNESIAKKILSLNSIWQELNDMESKLSQNEYVDLRFINNIYLWKAEETAL